MSLRLQRYQADEAAAADGVALAQFGAEEGEVEVFEQEQDGGQQHAGREQDERAGEVEHAERLARLALGVVLLARSRHPEPLQSLHLTCTHRTEICEQDLFSKSNGVDLTGLLGGGA